MDITEEALKNQMDKIRTSNFGPRLPRIAQWNNDRVPRVAQVRTAVLYQHGLLTMADIVTTGAKCLTWHSRSDAEPCNMEPPIPKGDQIYPHELPEHRVLNYVSTSRIHDFLS
jgi:hypothetical protein